MSSTFSRLKRLLACSMLMTGLLTLAGLTSSSHAARYGAPASLPVTTSGIHLGMEFNYLEPTVHGYKTHEANVDYVSGADAVLHDVPANSGHTWHDKYLSWSRDASGPDVQRSLAWYRQHHPTWVLYKRDRTTVPLAMGDNIAPLDFTNPYVRQYVLQQWIFPALKGGFQGILFDNNLGFNFLHAAGHRDAHGKWVQLYTGNWNDTRYASLQLAAFKQIVAAVHSSYPRATIDMNQGVDCDDNLIINQTGQAYANIIVDEQGFTNSANQQLPYVAQYSNQYCPNGKWITVARWAQHVGRDLGKGIFFINREQYNVTTNMTARNGRARFDLQWSLANYLLVKYAHAYFVWGGHEQIPGRPPIMQREYSAPIGSPTNDFYGSQGVFMRDYTGGRTVVNPALNTSYTVTFPTGKYRDLYGHSISRYTMPPHSGLVLLWACRSTAGSSSSASCGGSTSGP